MGNMEKTKNQIEAEKWVEAHYGGARELVKTVAYAAYYTGLVDKEFELTK